MLDILKTFFFSPLLTKVNSGLIRSPVIKAANTGDGLAGSPFTRSVTVAFIGAFEMSELLGCQSHVQVQQLCAHLR